jgi:SAM-dependent methyltransferase
MKNMSSEMTDTPFLPESVAAERVTKGKRKQLLPNKVTDTQPVEARSSAMQNSKGNCKKRQTSNIEKTQAAFTESDSQQASPESTIDQAIEIKLDKLPVSYEPWLETETYDAALQAWQIENPGKKFSHFSAAWVKKSLSKGVKHTTLGTKLIGEADWWKNGHPFYRKIIDMVDLPMNAKVCDYGCGSLRVGVHFIKRQHANCYFGLDVTDDFIKQGKAKARDIISKKRARTGTIEEKLTDAIKFSPDFLFTANVACHVHPDEVDEFYSNIRRIVHKNGGLVFLHCHISDEMFRYQRSGWSWPLDFYDKKMSNFELIHTVFVKNTIKGQYKLATYFLLYKRVVSEKSEISIFELLKDKLRYYTSALLRKLLSIVGNN